MTAMLTHLSASRRRSLQLVDFCKMRTTLPGNVIAWNGTYTRNSVKTVVQDGALVTLSANQFGTSYDDVTGLYGYVPEPAATNLATNSDGAASTYTVSNVVNGTVVPGFNNGIAFSSNSVQRYAYKSCSLSAGVVYAVSVFVVMDDGGAPVVGTTTTTGDFSLVCDWGRISQPALVREIGGSLYRVCSYYTATTGGAGSACGVIKYIGQSARTFRITGIQVETGLRATSYIATTGSTASRAADVLSIPLWVNNLLDSQDGSTSNWTKGNCTVTTSGTAPDGTATAQLITVSTTALTTCYNAGTKAPGKVVTYSVYVKQGNQSTCPLILRNNTTATNLTTGVLTFATGAITGTGWTATNVGNGWFRCTFTQSTGITVGDTLYCYAHFNGGTYTAGDTGYIWGAQIEPGSTATTYRPTTSILESAANRNIPNFNSAGHTLFADVRADVVPNTNNWIVTANDGSSNNRALLRSTAGITTFAISSGGVSQGGPSLATAIGTVRNKLAMSSALNSFKGALNATAATEDTVGTMPVAPTVLQIGHDLGGSQFNGFIFSAGVIPQALTQAQINGLTTL